MARHEVYFAIDCPLPADVILEALTDFSEKRLQYFPNLTADSFELLEQDAQTALVREGSASFYNQERYDWSTPGRIVSVIEESNIVSSGSSTDIRVTALSGDGSRVDIRLDREFIGWRGRLINLGISFSGRSRFFRKTYVRMLKDVEAAVKKSGIDA